MICLQCGTEMNEHPKGWGCPKCDNFHIKENVIELWRKAEWNIGSSEPVRIIIDIEQLKQSLGMLSYDKKYMDLTALMSMIPYCVKTITNDIVYKGD